MDKYFNKLTEVLSKDERLLVEGELDKNKIAELARKYDAELLNTLEKDKDIKDLFFTKTDGGLIFKKDVFLQFISDKEWLPDSYTAYATKIGLGTAPNDYLSQHGEVVLNWPYKDCVLEGGQDKEDQKRSEVFFNEVLAPDQINRLLDDKVFTNWKRYDIDGEKPLDKLNPNDNLIIKGNNLVVLHSLKKRYAGKVKLIYIDPPFNTDNDTFLYNDRFSRSTWLTFMKNRLEVAKQLLAPDGSIFVHLDFNQVHYCKVLMDEIFGEENFLNDIAWQYYMGGKKTNTYARKHDNILMYSRTKDGNFFKKLRIKRYLDFKPSLSDDSKGGENGKDDIGYYSIVAMPNVWSDIRSVFNMSKEWTGFNTQKPEKLLARIIETSTSEGDIILDYHLGSGTTAKVAHKLNRQYIGVEQLHYEGDLDSVNGLSKTIQGDKTEFSKEVNWQGGGSFVYCDIKNDANTFREKVKRAKAGEISKLLEEASKSSFLSYRVDPKKLKEAEFNRLSLTEQKRILLELIDNNTLYLNYSDINDSTYKISEEDKKFNNEFYRDR